MLLNAVNLIYYVYLTTDPATSKVIKHIKHIIYPQQLKWLPILIWDLLMFWNNNSTAIRYILYLYTRYKYNPALQQFSIPRYNLIWNLRRNFFIRNISYKYKPAVPVQCIKFYIILKQFLDDMKDSIIDKREGQITPITINNYFLNKSTWYKLTQLYGNKNLLCQKIIQFHWQFL